MKLTLKQLEKLEDVLFDTQDEGPSHAGWASPELQELRGLVTAEIAKRKGGC
jgi:hypothetical protein